MKVFTFLPLSISVLSFHVASVQLAQGRDATSTQELGHIWRIHLDYSPYSFLFMHFLSIFLLHHYP